MKVRPGNRTQGRFVFTPEYQAARRTAIAAYPEGRYILRLIEQGKASEALVAMNVLKVLKVALPFAECAYLMDKLNPLYVHRYALLLNRAERYQEALSVLVSLPSDKWTTNIFFCAALVQHHLKYFEAAMNNLERIPKDQWTLPVFNCAANILISLHRSAEALDLLGKNLGQTNWDTQSYICAAQAYLDLGQAEEVVALLSPLPRSNQELDLYCCLATAHNQLKQYQIALDLLYNLEIVFWNVAVFNCAATARNGLGQHQAAINLLASLEVGRWTIETYCTVAAAKIGLKDHQAALDHLYAVPRGWRANINYLNCLASACNGLGKYDATVGLLEPEKRPTKESRVLLAEAYIQLKKYTEALTTLSQIPFQKLDAPAIDYIAAAHIGRGEPQEAIGFLAGCPTNIWQASTHATCSQAYYDLGNFTLAIMQDDLAALKDTNAIVYSNRANVLRALRQFTEAEAFARRQLVFFEFFPTFAPNSKHTAAKALVTLGYILQEKPKPDFGQSVETLIKAHDKYPARDLSLSGQILLGLIAALSSMASLGEDQPIALTSTFPRLKEIIPALQQLLTAKSSELNQGSRTDLQKANSLRPSIERFLAT